MAVVGDVLMEPEEGWKRLDSSEIEILNTTGAWNTTGSEPNAYNKTAARTFEKNATLSFKFYGTKFRLITRSHPSFYSDSKVEIDGILYDANLNISDRWNGLSMEVLDMEEKVHDVTFIAGQESGHGPYDYSFYVTAIDIGVSDDIIPELSRDYEFPVKVGDEADVLDYAADLIGGEEQLLITREGILYLTDGNGSFKNISETDLTDYYNKQEVNTLIADVDNKNHEHNNKTVIDNLSDSANLLTYKGKVVVNNNEYSFKTLPRRKAPKSNTYTNSNVGGRLPWQQ